MRVTKIQLTGHNTTVNLPIVGARPSDRFQLLSVEGLGPPELNVAISPTLQQGGVFQGRQAHSRQLVFLIGLQPEWAAGETPESLRTELYGLFGTWINNYMQIILFDGDAMKGVLTGYISKIEINPFTKEPQAQITIDCPEPYISDIQATFVTPPAKDHFQIDYTGTAPCGFAVRMNFTADVPEQTIYTDAPHGWPYLYVFEPFLAGDSLLINTIPGLRDVYMKRSGQNIKIIRSLSSDSKWLMLHPGINDFWTLNQNFDWGDIWFVPQYWGI